MCNSFAGDPDDEKYGLPGIRDLTSVLGKVAPGAKYKVVVLENNSRKHTLMQGLAVAHSMNELERIGPVLPMFAAACCLQAYHVNRDGYRVPKWDQGLLFFTPSQVYHQPASHVVRMVSSNYLPLCMEVEVKSPGNALDVTAKKSEDRKMMALNVVNLGPTPVTARMALEGFTPRKPSARVTELKGELDAENTPGDPDRIVPAQRDWRHRVKAGKTVYTFPPHSFTIIRFE
jgi:alpha-L-arabinofuranosidase